MLIEDSQLQEAVAAFGRDYGMYCDWCASMYSPNATLVPATINKYMAKYYEVSGLSYEGN